MSKKTPKYTAESVKFTSDTHFFHKKAAEFRNFSSVEVMNETLVSLWNSIVQDKDVVFHLGDVGFGSQRETEDILYRLNGQIVLIRGNHDRSLSSRAKKRFLRIEDLFEIDVVEQFGPKYRIILCHFAMRVWNKHHYGSWQLFGHSHGNLSPIGRQMDVGVDTNNLQPYTFKQIKDRLADKEVHVMDHHVSTDREVHDDVGC